MLPSRGWSDGYRPFVPPVDQLIGAVNPIADTVGRPFLHADEHMLTAFAFLAAACGFGVLASIVMSRASNRSALWNMGFAVVMLIVLIALLYGTAWIVTSIAVRR